MQAARNPFIKFLSLCAVIALMANCSVFSGKETTGEYVDDATLTAKIKSEIMADKPLKADNMRISIETMDGVVQLSGFVSSERNKERAEQIVRNVKGVKTVKNNIIVKKGRKEKEEENEDYGNQNNQ